MTDAGAADIRAFAIATAPIEGDGRVEQLVPRHVSDQHGCVDSGSWLHLADNSRWVSFAGVKATPTAHDPTGTSRDARRPRPHPDIPKSQFNERTH
jgi:hypothetical protein